MECATVLKLKLVVYSEYCFDLVIHMEFISVKPAMCSFTCADPESFVRGGPTLTIIVFFCKLMRS